MGIPNLSDGGAEPQGGSGEDTDRLTARRRTIVQWIQAYTAEHGYPPSQREIAQGVGCAVGRIPAHLAALIREGVITATPGKHRSIRVVEGGE